MDHKHEDFNKMISECIHAIANGHISTLSNLIKQGLEINLNYSPQKPYYETFLSYAIAQEKKEVAHFLLNEGAFPNSLSIEKALEQKNWKLAIKQIKHAQFIQLDLNKIFSTHVPLEESTRIIQAVIRNGFPLDEISTNSDPIIRYPLKQNNFPAIKALIQNGLNIYPPINPRDTPLKFSQDLIRFNMTNRSLFVNMDSTTHDYLQDLQNNPNQRYDLVKDTLIKTLSWLPKKIQDMSIHRESIKQILEKTEGLKNTFLKSGYSLSPLILNKTLWFLNRLIQREESTISKISTIPLHMHLEKLHQDIKKTQADPSEAFNPQRAFYKDALPDKPFFALDQIREYEKFTPATMQKFYLGVKNGDLKEVKNLHHEGMDLNLNYSKKFPYAKTFLKVAIDENQKEMVDFLLKKGAIPNSLAIETSLSKQDWDLAEKLIHHAHTIKINPRKILANNVPIHSSNRILDAIIKNGCDLNESLKDPYHRLLDLALWQKNGIAIQKLITNGVDLSYPSANSQSQLRSLRTMLVYNIDPTTKLFIENLVQNLDHRNHILRENIMDLLDTIPKNQEISCLHPIDFQKILKDKDVLKSAIHQQFNQLSFSDLKKIQIRINHILNHPANKIPLLAGKVLNQNRTKYSSTQTHPFAEGFPPNIAKGIERSLQALMNEESLSLHPIFQRVERLNMSISESRGKKAIPFDYNNERAKLKLIRDI
jgi:hypothetical protein